MGLASQAPSYTESSPIEWVSSVLGVWVSFTTGFPSFPSLSLTCQWTLCGSGSDVCLTEN